ncbi:hypothetical protein AHAS_Ahas19G0105400 [Arachis hypogaea]
MSHSDKTQVDSLNKFGIATSKIMAYMARYTRTAEDQLGSPFWADGQMMADYQLFVDVIAFDSTYRPNKYKKPLVVFSGSNHHMQKSTFGFVLLEDEEVFKNAIYANFDVEEFEKYWKTALESLKLMNNTWVKSPCDIRQSWAMAYLRELFASKMYTRGVFKEVKKQIKGVGTLLFFDKDNISTTTIYKFSKMGNRCRVRKYEGLVEIPQGLILRSAMTLVVKLAFENVGDFVVARDAISDLAQMSKG